MKNNKILLITFNNNMRKIILCILLATAISCTTSTIRINDAIISELAEHDFEIPSVHGFALLFVSCGENYKAFTNINVLHEIFVKDFAEKYPDFRSFLSDALNQRINFSEKDLNKWQIDYFKLNEDVKNAYSQLVMADFVDKYFDSTGDIKKLSIKVKFNNDVYSILYFCFINNYKITLDDYNGKYFISRFKVDKY